MPVVTVGLITDAEQAEAIVGTGDADLYVRKGSKPTTSTFDCRPYITRNSETCTFANPAAADYYVMVRGYATFTGVTLVGHDP